MRFDDWILGNGLERKDNMNYEEIISQNFPKLTHKIEPIVSTI